MILFSEIICVHTLIGKVWHTIVITEGGGEINNKNLGDCLQTLAHPFKHFHKIYKVYFGNHMHGRIAKLA